MNTNAVDPEAVPIKAAATVIPLRDGEDGLEVLVLRRDTKLAFHGGSWVFPGGRVDPEEEQATTDELAAARLAAAREAKEEAGLDIDPAHLITLSHWTTPLGRNRRFATWFFAVAAPPGEIVIDDGEIRAFEWYTIEAAIVGCEAGQIMLAAPAYVSLLRLRQYQSVVQALQQVAARPDEVFLPRIMRRGQETFTVYQDDPAYQSGDIDTAGARHRLQVLKAGYRYINEIDPLPMGSDPRPSPSCPSDLLT